MTKVETISQYYDILEKNEYSFIVYHSENGCAACHLLINELNSINPSHLYYINVDKDVFSSLLYRINITQLPTIEKYNYYKLKDLFEGYDASMKEKLKKFLIK